MTTFTVTSTTYSSRYTATYTSIHYVATTMIETTLTQTGFSGPYVNVEYQLDFLGNHVRLIFGITNLLPVLVSGGGILVTDYFQRPWNPMRLPFGSIRPGEKIVIVQDIDLPTPNFTARSVEIYCSGLLITTAIPTYYTYYGTKTETYVTTYVTVGELPSMAFLSDPLFFGVVIIACALLIFALWFKREKRSSSFSESSAQRSQPTVVPSASGAQVMGSQVVQPASAQSKPSPSVGEKSEVVYCVHCGAEIPEFATFCRKCGKSQKEFERIRS